MPGESAMRMVVIGTSSGGIDALETLLPCVPANARATVVCVIHRPDDGRGGLTDLFAGRCAVPVREADDKEPAERAAIFFAPAGYHLLVETDVSFALSVDEPVNYARPSIDVLFASAARAVGRELLGIVLTGANDDGAAGLLAIRRAGGTAWVQSPDDAAAPAMPRAALERAGAERVLTLAEMRQALPALL